MKLTAIPSSVLIALCMCILQPLHAQKDSRWQGTSRIVTAIPRAMGRTAKNMVTFRDPMAALEEWGTCAAVAVDVAESIHVLKLDPTAIETSPLMPKRPTSLEWSIYGFVGCLGEASYTQWGHEYLDSSYKWPQNFGGLAISGIIHGKAASDNASNASLIIARRRLSPGAIQ